MPGALWIRVEVEINYREAGSGSLYVFMPPYSLHGCTFATYVYRYELQRPRGGVLDIANIKMSRSQAYLINLPPV